MSIKRLSSFFTPKKRVSNAINHIHTHAHVYTTEIQKNNNSCAQTRTQFFFRLPSSLFPPTQKAVGEIQTTFRRENLIYFLLILANPENVQKQIYADSVRAFESTNSVIPASRMAICRNEKESIRNQYRGPYRDCIVGYGNFQVSID